MVKLRIKTWHLLAVPFLLATAGITVWLAVEHLMMETCSEDYPMINPELRCAERPVIRKTEYEIFKSKLIGKIDAWKKEGRILEAAIFFRDLANGPTFGINDRENFIPASLLKVPLMMTYLKLAEEDPGLLERKLTVDDTDKADSIDQYIPPAERVESGKSYTIDELIFKMITTSDNRAWFLLWDYLQVLSPHVNLFYETYRELGFADFEDTMDAQILTAKAYASIFRLLYNASFLSKGYSEKALSYLSRVEYADGLRGGIPENILIAHKFGERWFADDTGQLHDCGIVYYPGNPYLICILVRGKHFEYLSEVVQDISRAVYEEVDSRRQ